MILCREVIGQFRSCDWRGYFNLKILRLEKCKSCSFPQRLQRRKLSSSSRSNGKWASLSDSSKTSNRDFNRENFLSVTAALPYDPFPSMANNWHQHFKLIFRMHRLSNGPFRLVFMPVSVKGFALFTQQDIGQFRRGLELYHKLCISGNKIRWKLQLAGFSYDKKSANVVMWKDKEYEYISSAWNKPE